MNVLVDHRAEAVPPPPFLSRLTARGYSPRERLCIDLTLMLVISLGVMLVLPHRGARVRGADYDLLAWIDVGVSAALFMARRRIRWPALIGVTVLELLALVLRLPGPASFFMVFCLYAVVANSAQRTGLVFGGLCLALTVAAAILGGDTPENSSANLAVCLGALVLIGWLAGENARSGRIYSQYRSERERVESAAAEAERAERTRRTIADERVTIARELHDIVAHSMSVVAVRSGVARMVLDSRPEEAVEALAIIETTARQSLAEMRMMVSMLRGAGTGASEELGPLPGLGDLDRLVSQLAAAGVEVDLEVDGSARPLAPAADLTAYRIVQEALTNVVRHAAPTSATVRLAYGGDELEIEVSDLGADRGGRVGAPLSGREAGHGLVGMRERAAMLGGMLEAGPAERGFRVHTRLRIDG